MANLRNPLVFGFILGFFTIACSENGVGRQACAEDSMTECALGFERVELLDDSGVQSLEYSTLVGIAFLPDQETFVVAQKDGLFVHFLLEEDNRAVRLGQFQLPSVFAMNDCGINGFAFDPSWSSNAFLYISHCVSGTSNRIVRIYFDGTSYENVGDTAVTVVEVQEPDAKKDWHNGGSLGFFDDEYHSMWAAFGEKTVQNNAQDPTNLLGTIVRIIPNRDPEGSGYEAHPDNRLLDFPPHPEITRGAFNDDVYAYGFRMPWRVTMDSQQRLWVSDVGNSKYEEINVVDGGGKNFGWPIFEGPCNSNTSGCSDFTNPIAYWNHGEDNRYIDEDPDASSSVLRVAWVGGAYVDSDKDPYQGLLDDSVLFGDMCLGYIRKASSVDAHVLDQNKHLGNFRGISAVIQNPHNRYLYFTSFGACSNGDNLSGPGAVGVYRMTLQLDSTD